MENGERGLQTLGVFVQCYVGEVTAGAVTAACSVA